jgi:RNA polymerase-interacting CarD/CdnL/TRCF family regulator
MADLHVPDADIRYVNSTAERQWYFVVAMQIALGFREDSDKLLVPNETYTKRGLRPIRKEEWKNLQRIARWMRDNAPRGPQGKPR